jgi:large subunit ribosomal protein L21
MYAVIKAGGKQHKVSVGDVIEVERLVGSDETVTFQPLLVVDDEGRTHAGSQAAKAVVTAKPLGEKKGDKIKIFKYRPKTGYAKRGGHRQLLTLLEIQDVALGSDAKRSNRATSSKKDPTSTPSQATDVPESADVTEPAE